MQKNEGRYVALGEVNITMKKKEEAEFNGTLLRIRF